MKTIHEKPQFETAHCLVTKRVSRVFLPRRLVWPWFYQLFDLEPIVVSFPYETDDL